LLDEATANLDIETDYLIQNTIQEAFKECTVITVAHRLNTIANYDRIIVMQRGKVSRYYCCTVSLSNKREVIVAITVNLCVSDC